tara:strand:- start:4116 stop:4472 length:357 start_codon:yes stop_codon:yes gene_type:complete
MIASSNTLKRMCERKLQRWGIVPRLRGGACFLCEEKKLVLHLGDFWAIFVLDEEVKMANPNEPINSILWNRKSHIKSGENPYAKWLESEKKPRQDEIEEQKDQIIDILQQSNKIQVQV